MQASSYKTATVLPEATWHERRAAHELRVRAWTDPHQARTARGEKHPVHDFLFEYYRFRPSWLKRWHPGPDVVLLGDTAREFLRWPEYHQVTGAEGPEPVEGAAGPELVEGAAGPELVEGIALNVAAFEPTRRDSLAWMLNLLRITAERAPSFGCFGLHEWAMVYRQSPDEVRHNTWPLRFPPDELARIVEAQPVRCSHFDAFRFFTAPARPLNRLQPERTNAPLFEQRGCLHANMDLYKWAFKLAPFTPAELVADCFALARDIREVDMRASPYDLARLGFAPICIETPEGRAEYETFQRDFADRSQPLRARLIAVLERLLTA